MAVVECLVRSVPEPTDIVWLKDGEEMNLTALTRSVLELHVYSGPRLIGTPLLKNNSAPIREVYFGEREHYINHGTWYEEFVLSI